MINEKQLPLAGRCRGAVCWLLLLGPGPRVGLHAQCKLVCGSWDLDIGVDTCKWRWAGGGRLLASGMAQPVEAGGGGLGP